MPMKPLCLLLVPILFGPLIAVGQTRPSAPETGTLCGGVTHAVTNAFKSPLPHAFVFIHSEWGVGDKFVKLDKEARFQVSLVPGLYCVFVTAPGFVPTCKKLEIVKGQTTQFVPTLKADLEHMIPD